jgi:hypothetical protein
LNLVETLFSKMARKCETRRFVLATSVSPPAAPLSLSPADPDTVIGTSILFSWRLSAGATRFTLEFSRDSLFTQSSDLTWTVEGITDSTRIVELREGASMMFWRVKGVNSGGESGWSSPSRFTYVGGTVLPIQSVIITEPEAGSQIPLGSSFTPMGRVAGSYSGTIEGVWLLGNVPVDSFSLVMDPEKGVEVQGPVVSTEEIGQDTLVLALTSPVSVFSPPLPFTVVPAASGAVAGFHLVASPFAVAADSQSHCTITAFAVDGEGRRVWEDFARLVSFVVLGEGYIVGPSSSFTDSGAVRVIVSSTRTPDSDVLVIAYSLGVPASYTLFMTYDEDLEEYVTRVLAHMERLERLPLDYYPEGIDTTAGGYDLSALREFLDEEIFGVPDPLPESIESLRRLSLALEFLDMNYYYEHDPLFPEEDREPLYGAGYFYDQVCGSASGAAVVADFLPVMADRVLQTEGTTPALVRISHSVFRNSQHQFDGLVMPLLESEVAESESADVLDALVLCHRESALLARQGEDPLSLVENYTLRLPRHFEFLGDYVLRTQDLVDSAASWALSHAYSSSFEESRRKVDDLLLESRSMTNTSFLSSEDLDADGSFYLSSRELSLLGEAVSQGLETGPLIAKLRETAGYASSPERWSGGGEIVSLSLRTTGDLETRLLPQGVWASFGMEPPIARPVREFHALALGNVGEERIENSLLSFTEKCAEFEEVARNVMSGISADDSAAVTAGVDEVCDAGDRMLELMHLLRGTFGSLSPAARGSVGDFETMYEEMNRIPFMTASALTSFELFLADYLVNREYNYAIPSAIDAGSEAIETAHHAVRRFSEVIPSFFDLPALPALVLTHLSFPDSVGPARIFAVNAFLKNAGAGEATGISALLGFEGPFELLSAASLQVPSLAAGDSVHLSWVLKAKSPHSPELVRGLYSSSVEVYSADALTYPRFFLLKAYPKSFGVNKSISVHQRVGEIEESSLPHTYRLSQNSPNPFNPQTTIDFDIPEGEPQEVNLRIYDVRGRLVRVLVDQMKAPGTHMAVWDGRSGKGDLLGTGVYFYVLDAGEFHSVKKMLLRK